MITRINNIISAFMIILCLVFAFFILFTELLADSLQGKNRHILAAIMIGYAAFRTYRLITTIREQKMQEDEDENEV